MPGGRGVCIWTLPCVGVVQLVVERVVETRVAAVEAAGRGRVGRGRSCVTWSHNTR
jgi:hypothetical protein